MLMTTETKLMRIIVNAGRRVLSLSAPLAILLLLVEMASPATSVEGKELRNQTETSSTDTVDAQSGTNGRL